MVRKNRIPAPPCTITGMGVVKCNILIKECALPSAGGPIAILASMRIAGSPGTAARKRSNPTMGQLVLGLQLYVVTTGDELSIIGNLFQLVKVGKVSGFIPKKSSRPNGSDAQNKRKG